MRFPRFLAFLVLLLTGTAQASTDQQVMTTLHMLDYVGVDYPEFVQGGEVLNADEYQEQAEFARRVIGTLESLPAQDGQWSLIEKAKLLQAAIHAKANGAQVTQMTAELSREVLRVYPIVIAPRQAPDVAKAAVLYEAQCAGCHGRSGHGDGQLVTAAMQPAPANFHEAARQRQRSVFGLYNVITLGVNGTAMPSFAQLPEDQRWALAFYVGQMLYTDAQREAGKKLWNARGPAAKSIADLKTLTTLTPGEFMAQHGTEAEALMAFLRAKPGVADTGADPITISRDKLAASLVAYRAHDNAQAMQLALSSYLEGFELAEAGLSAMDAPLMRRVETAMMQYRQLIQENAPVETVEQQAATTKHLLDEAEQRLAGGGMSATGSFVGSFVILAREGLEAILVLAAMIAFLRKAERPEGLPWVHAGWISALVLGVVTWFVATYLIDISGASREKTEGYTALLASVILLSVGLWLHNKSYSHRWQQYVSHKMKGALSGGRLWGLTLLAFIAVYREVFETVLFYRALWAQGDHAAIVFGFLVAAVLLIGVAWAIFYFSMKLPIRQFFSWSSAFIVVLAVIFTGKGVAALQEAGAIPVHSVDFVSIPMLGVYPTLQVLLMQIGVLVLVLAGFAWNHLSARRAAAAT
jgi:high-affinity iron transporter